MTFNCVEVKVRMTLKELYTPRIVLSQFLLSLLTR